MFRLQPERHLEIGRVAVGRVTRHLNDFRADRAGPLGVQVGRRRRNPGTEVSRASWTLCGSVWLNHRSGNALDPGDPAAVTRFRPGRRGSGGSVARSAGQQDSRQQGQQCTAKTLRTHESGSLCVVQISDGPWPTAGSDLVNVRQSRAGSQATLRSHEAIMREQENAGERAPARRDRHLARTSARITLETWGMWHRICGTASVRW